MPTVASLPAAALSASSLCGRFHTLGGLLNQGGHGFGLGHVDRVTALCLDDRRAGALRHEMLGRRGNHLVLGGDQIPARLRLPRGFGDRATERLDAPWHLRISHERGLVRPYVGRE